MAAGDFGHPAPVLPRTLRADHLDWHGVLQECGGRGYQLPELDGCRLFPRLRECLQGALFCFQGASGHHILLGLHIHHVLHWCDAGCRPSHSHPPEEAGGHEPHPVGERGGKPLPGADRSAAAHQALPREGQPLRLALRDGGWLREHRWGRARRLHRHGRQCLAAHRRLRDVGARHAACVQPRLPARKHERRGGQGGRCGFGVRRGGQRPL
mmetsp:Transcript_65077/g.146768  ORF Transcript_65077/g.146768 Transcript_65077/m.146768 type:complete len:211 (-) Transcript_65077:652-1284(-)